MHIEVVCLDCNEIVSEFDPETEERRQKRNPRNLVIFESLRREYVEAAAIFGFLLAIRWLNAAYPSLANFDLFWHHGWYAVYVVVGVALPFIMEIIVRRRRLSLIGFKLPINRRVLMIVTGLLALQFVGGIVLHTLLYVEFNLDPRHIAGGLIIGVFLEEANFRGLIQTRLEAGLGPVKSWVFSGLLFGFYHYWVHFLILGKTLTALELFMLMDVTVLGFLFGVVFSKTRSLLPSFMLHSINNFVAFLSW